MSGWTNLVQAETLAIAIGRPDVKLVDCRFTLINPGAGESAWMNGRIPGAVYAHLDRDLSNMRRTGAGRHPWPDEAAFTQRLGEWGIGPDDQIVAYDDGDGAHAARFWFLMRMLGHEKVAVLDGGWSRWTSLGLAVDTAPHKPITTRYVGHFDQSRLLDADQVQQHLAQGDVLIDARAADRFRGEIEPIDRIAGHVPGAVNRPFGENLDHGKFKTPPQLADEFRAVLHGKPAEEAIVMCGSGVTACHHLLAMERAGLRGAKLFTGSWSGWISDPSRPVATGV
jgi:thiosulfate/3-mercaptopyruvate sulfurtransferase